MDNRKKQALMLLQPPKSSTLGTLASFFTSLLDSVSDLFSDDIARYLHQIAGFFIIENYVAETTDINPTAVVEAMWDDAVSKIKVCIS